ncbi:TolC family protein [Mangrovibacter plantisponsor]|uniref:Outer membrane protein TolC n=1 Tax=Mangrovibacter plantisponsor TaxID=451513 RepID=A0A317Q1X4_9ENTR|nr:TolC family protein [Mangrovibacter plantisponsor]PWW07046.1 outer membrane protein TolC [Mangrovibacter plantisponsor]
MKRPWKMAACGLPVLLWLSAAQATTLEASLQAAQAWSAGLSANAHQVNALENMAVSAGQLPDPKLLVGIDNVPVQGNNSHRLTREGMTMEKIGISQTWVSGTKRQRKVDTLQAQAREVESGKGVILAQLQRDTAQAWLTLAIARKTLAAIDEQLAETQRQVAVQKASVASGSAQPDSAVDISLAVNEMLNLQDNARRDIQVAQARLMQLTGEEITQTSGPFPRIERLPASAAVLLEAVQQHPEIIQAARAADVAKARSQQSAVAAQPDVGVQVYYGRRGDGMDDLAGVQLSVDLPLFQGTRQDKDYSADLSRAMEAKDQLTLLVREHKAQLNALIAQYQSAQAIYQRQRDTVLPLLQAKYRLTEAQYRAGNSTLTALLAARRAQLNGNVALSNNQQAMATAWAAIRYLTVQDSPQ